MFGKDPMFQVVKNDNKRLIKFRKEQVEYDKKRLKSAEKALAQAKKTRDPKLIAMYQSQVDGWKRNVINETQSLKALEAEFKRKFG